MHSPPRRPLRATIESLEPRRLLAAFGTPWPEPRELTISFPADGTPIGSYANESQATYDQIASRQAWEELALRAFQSWAVHADINVGLRNDHDIDFGTPGLTMLDPRFGEFRIGAFPQVGLLASSVPFHAEVGTYSGDILLNSNVSFRYHDWAGGLPPDPQSLGPDDYDLYSVLLHESGNSLGLSDSADDTTVMFGQYTVPKGILTQHDIDQIQALYGTRSDPYEQVDNGLISLATIIPTPTGFDPDADVIRVRGSLGSGSDVDVFEISPMAGRESATIQLHARGISLLQSRLEIFDATGQLIDESLSVSVFDNDIVIEVSGLPNQTTIYVRVSPIDPTDVYSVGDYEISIDYRTAAARASDPVASDYDASAGSLLTNFALVDAEQGVNDTIAGAEAMIAHAAHNATRYELESSVSSAADVDYWKATAPPQADGRLVVNVASVGLGRPDLRIRIVDGAGQSVGATGWLRPDGTWALEVAHPQASQDYFIRVSVDPNSPVSVGNYVVVAEYPVASAEMNDFISGEVSSSVDTFVRWSAAKTKLYRFDLQASGGSSDEFVRLTIYDAHTQQMRMVMETPSGVTRTALAWLSQGDYVLRFSAVSPSGNPVSSLTYILTGDGVSDDQDDSELDPDETDPSFNGYDYYYDEELDPYAYYEYDSNNYYSGDMDYAGDY